MAVLTETEIGDIAKDRAQVNVSTNAPISATELRRFLNDAYADVWQISGGRLRIVASATAWTSAQSATGIVTGILTDVEEVTQVFASTIAASVGLSTGDFPLDRVEMAVIQHLRGAQGYGTYTVPKLVSVNRLATTGTEIDSAAVYIRPDAQTGGADNWTGPAAETTNLYAHIDETTASDLDWVSATTDSVAGLILTLGDFATAPVSGNTVTLRYRAMATSPATLTVYLMEGATVIASQVAVTTSAFSDLSMILTEAERAAVGVWTNLSLKFVKGGVTGTARVSYAALENAGTPSYANLLRMDYWPGVTGFYFPIHYVPQFRPFNGTILTPDVNDIESRDIALLAAARMAPLVGRAELVPSILADVSTRTAAALERKLSALIEGKQDR